MIFDFSLTPNETVRVQLALARYITWLERQQTAAGSGSENQDAHEYWQARIDETVRLHRMFLEPVRSRDEKTPPTDRGVNSDAGEGQS